ncbi:MAG: hypothetical protein ACLU9S_22790 [Oscillospiraceae bacterium]
MGITTDSLEKGSSSDAWVKTGILGNLGNLGVGWILIGYRRRAVWKHPDLALLLGFRRFRGLFRGLFRRLFRRRCVGRFRKGFGRGSDRAGPLIGLSASDRGQPEAWGCRAVFSCIRGHGNAILAPLEEKFTCQGEG